MTEPSGPTSASKPSVTLSRDLGDFLIEFSIALNEHAMYPDGHPSLGPAAERVVHRLLGVLEGRATLSLGVARNQLVIEGVATDSKNPVLRDLAGRLHRHHLGAITFRRGATPGEIHQVLQLLAADADRGGEPLGLGPAERLAAWAHVRLYPLSYQRLDLIEEPGDEPDAGPEARQDRTRAAQLWVGLARAALASETGRETSADEATPTDPAVVARAIEAHPPGAAYDQVIVGYLLQIAEETKGGAAAEDPTLRRRVSRLINELDPETLTRLLEMGGDRSQRQQFVLNAADGLAVGAVIDLVRAAGQAQHETVSHSMLRMLQKLAHHAQGTSSKRRALADQSVREQIGQMVRGWSLEDPNPDAYREALKRMATQRPSPETPTATQLHAEPERTVQMALEVEAIGDSVLGALRALVERGRLAWVAEMLDGAPSESVALRLWDEIANPDAIRRVVTAEPVDVKALDLLLPRVGMDAAGPMLDALTTSESSHTRRILLDRLVGLGAPVGPLAVERLTDVSWYVQRNMLAILSELPDRPADFNAKPFLEHTDARVRREAFRILFKDPATRDRAICHALTDPEDRVVRLGLTAAQQGCPDAAVPLAASLAARAPSEEQRTAAIRALGASRNPAAMDVLLALIAPRKRWLWRTRPPKTAEFRAAVTVLRGLVDLPRVRKALADVGES